MSKPSKPKVAALEQSVELAEEAAASAISADLLEPADFGLTVDADGLVSLEMLVSMEGPELSLAPKMRYRCDPQQACRFVRADFARQGVPQV